MFYKFTLASFLFVVAAMVYDLSNNQLISESGGAPAGHTGSPGDGKNCTQCHSNMAADTSGSIFSDVPSTGFMADTVYNVTAAVVHATATRFGFQASPQNVAGALQGQLIVTDANRTRLIGFSKYITHTATGTTPLLPGGNQWMFQWKAPNVTVPVTFYAAFNCANNNGVNTGDSIMVTSYTINPAPTNGIEESEAQSRIRIFPNPATRFIGYSIAGNLEQGASLTIWNINGQLIQEVALDRIEGVLDLSKLSSGIYFARFINGERVSVTRFSKL